MRIQLSDHFTYTKLLRYSFPSIVMTVFTSIYGIMDGLFVSNFAGKTPFAAISLILPFVFAMGSVGFMVGTGGAAIIAKTLGEQQHEKANRISKPVSCSGKTQAGACNHPNIRDD